MPKKYEFYWKKMVKRFFISKYFLLIQKVLQW
jgi:hypothetical protein